ncbi:hypothetical protein EIP91_000747 [Steccherinum ochraceum]|uniref:WD40 repeat-like protein n=1 Tax=Steccherinum ochraceum TaxID=92696 RepID=A0A4R0RSX2_9APHY|nr:hypothetical protein EIP91_000747 [Steccherinum ochraceum]
MGRGPQLPSDTATYPPNDFSALPTVSVAATPPIGSDHGARSDHHHRKQTLMTLLNALTELSKNEEMNGGDPLKTGQPSFEDDKDVPTVDEHLQKVGAEAFHMFQRRITNLDRELRNFANAARQLGSSVGILSSAFHLRERLAQILFLFRENAADLFPRKITREPREAVFNPAIRKLRKRSRDGASTQIVNTSALEDIDCQMFPEQLKLFAEDVTTFLECLNEFPEFTDEAVNSSIMSLDGDLKYWASCLKVYEGQFKYPAVQRYLHDLTSEMGEHLDSINSSLSIFIEVGVPTIRFAQKHAAANLLNLSTVATFFSAVTATTLQFSFDKTGDPLSDSVNGFWFTSLVFSIGAAVNSLLGLTWKQAMYRSPGHRVPWWVLIWIKRSPLVFLVLSVACFSMGLVLFTYSSQQHRVVSTVTTVFSACSCFGLAAVSTWFASERWIYNQHKGTKWLADALSETKIQLYAVPAIGWMFHQPRAAAQKIKYWSRRRSSDAGDFFLQVRNSTMEVLRVRRTSTVDDDREKNDIGSLGSPIPQSLSPEPMSPTSPYGRPTGRMSETVTTLPTIAESNTLFDGAEPRVSTTSETGSSGEQSASRPMRLRQAVRSVMMMTRSANAASAFTPQRQRTMSSEASKARRATEPPALLKSSRVAALVPKLRALETTQDLAAHSALVRHLQFSPNGKFLATSSWDRTSVIFRVGVPFTSHRVLAHPQGFVGQVAWSPSGNTLLTKLGRGVKLWTEEGVCKRTIDRKQSVHSVAWMPGGEAFLSVEGEIVTKLDVSGHVLDQYHFERMMVHDVAITQNCQRMLVVGSLTASQDGLHPSKSRAEKQIISYNLDKKEIENRVPVLHEVRDITLAGDDQVALAPPQLWKLELLKEGSRLSLRHTYMPKVTVDFAGPSYFGGKNDQLILCAGKGGDIHIWDRESATLLHHVRAQVLGGDLTCIAWNHAQDSFMFATGSHDGAVRIWTTASLDDGASGYLTVDRDDYGSSRATTNPLSTPRTRSPSPLDMEPRITLTESPSTQLTFQLTESLDRYSGSTQPDGQISPQPSADSSTPIMYRRNDQDNNRDTDRDRDRERRAVTFT